MEEKQTAVEWLVEQLKENNMLTFDEWTEMFDQAKAIEKEQLKDAYIIGRKGRTIKDFNETFKSE